MANEDKKDFNAKMLSQQLRDLENDGMVLREVIPEKPPKTIYSLTLCFIIGSLIPYKNHPFLHVSLPMVTIILSILLIAFIIKEKQKNEPFKAHLLNQWYFYGLSIIALSLIFFGQINGIVEILTLIFIFWMLSLLQR